LNATRSICVSLELEFDDERVVGRLEDEQGNERRFSSWLDLLTLIARMPADGSSPGDRSWDQQRWDEMCQDKFT
jgi:hypothetical protein